MRIAVFGATGDQGEAQLRALARSGHEAFAVTRRAGTEKGTALAGVRTLQADYDLPESLLAVCAAVDVAFVNLPSSSFQPAGRLLAQVSDLANAAADAKLGLIVFNTSMIVRDRPLGFASHDTRLALKQRLRVSEVPMVVVKPVIYADNLQRAWARPDIVERGVLAYPHADSLGVQWICLDDVARLMIAASERPYLAGREFTVGGPEVLRGPETAERLTRALGKPIRFETLPIPQFARRMSKVFGSAQSLDPQRLEAELERIYRWYNESPERPFQTDMSEVLEHLPVELTPIEAWARGQRWD